MSLLFLLLMSACSVSFIFSYNTSVSFSHPCTHTYCISLIRDLSVLLLLYYFKEPLFDFVDPYSMFHVNLICFYFPLSREMW